MPHSEKCPICGGGGKALGGRVCHGCNGKGWIEMQDSFPPEPGSWPWSSPFATTGAAGGRIE